MKADSTSGGEHAVQQHFLCLLLVVLASGGLRKQALVLSRDRGRHLSVEQPERERTAGGSAA